MSIDQVRQPLAEIGRRRLFALITGLATPVVLASISQTLMGLVDTLMVGRLGEAPLAAVGVATLLFSAVVMSIKAIDVATQTFTARRIGEQRDGEVGAVLATALTLALSAGALVTCLGLFWPHHLIALVSNDAEVRALGEAYLRLRYPSAVPLLFFFVVKAMFDGVGWTRIGMGVGIGMNVLNVVLNWVLIFGRFGAPAMGVGGAALATTLSSVAAALMIAVIALRSGPRRRFRLLCRSNFQPRLLGPFLRIAWPPAVQTLGNLLAILIFFFILGRISTLAVAAGNVALRVASLSFMPGFGIGAAIQTMVGQALGRGDPRGARRAARVGVGLAVAFMGSIGVVFFLVPGAVMGLFSSSADLIAAGVPVLRLLGLVQFVDAVGITLAGALRGAGQTRIVMIVDIVSGFCLLPLLTYLFGIVLGWGLVGAFVGLATWFSLFSVGMVILFLRGGWEATRL